MSKSDLHFMSISEVSDLIRTKEISPVEYVTSLINRTEEINPLIDAYVLFTPELAIDQAKVAEAEIAAGKWRGPMHGIPFALKDIYNTAGIRTTAHSKQLIDNVPSEDAETVRRLFDAGAILMGKLSTFEFAHGGPAFDLPFPPARNPWNLAYNPGGSSSGSGAAVAAGLVPIALGSDTGGSIRIPAGMCGVVGLKPTYGLVSKRGVITNSFSFDHAGPLTWTVEDCAISMQALAGYDAGDPGSANVPIPEFRKKLRTDLKGVRIGHVGHFYQEDSTCSEAQQRAMSASLDVLRNLGATVEEVKMRPLQTYFDIKIVIAETELLSAHHFDLLRNPYDFSSDLRRRCLASCAFTALDYVGAMRLRRKVIDEANVLFEKYDALVTLGAGPAKDLASYNSSSFWKSPKISTVFNVVGGGAITVCNGFTNDGLPLAMDIVSGPFEDATALAIAHAFEKSTDWRDRRPDLRADMTKPAIVQPNEVVLAPDLDDATRQFAKNAAERCGLTLDDHLFAEMLESIPYALEMSERIGKCFARDEELASTFAMPRSKTKP